MVNKEEALKMIKKIKAYKISEGNGGQSAVDINTMADAISKISMLAEATPEICGNKRKNCLGIKKVWWR